MNKKGASPHYDPINLSKISKALKLHGISLIAVSLFDLGYFFWFLIKVIIASNSNKYMGEAGWGLVFLWIVLMLLFPFALIALYYLIRGIRFIRTGNSRAYKNAPLDSGYLIKARHSAILQEVLSTIEILCVLIFMLVGWVKYDDFGVIPLIFVALHIGLLFETSYFSTQLRSSER